MAKANKCGVKHPHLRGVTCDQKRGHKHWHSSRQLDHWDEVDHVLMWDKGRGRRRRDIGRWTMRVVTS